MPWTMIHGFYAGMGGFVFELDFTDEEAAFYGTRNPPLIITSRGIALLAACGHLPDIRKEDIVDKSKSDSIAKSVVCLQAGWMIVQILGRLALGLPITLLEINTLGHILCALIIYLLWWHKPQTISEPTRLSGPWVKSLYAYMYVSSKIDDAGSHYYGKFRRKQPKPELLNLLFVPSCKALKLTLADLGIESSTDILDNTYAQPILRHGPNRLNVDEVASSRNSTKYSVQLKKNMKFENDSLGTQTDIETSLSPSSSQLRRWDLAAEAVSQYPAIRSKFNVRRNNAADVEMTIWLEPSENKMEDLITSHVGNWPSAGLLRGIGGLIMGMILWFASVAYGGVHATAWNGHFPSEVELWSWRFSSIYVIFSGLLWLLINMLAQIFKQIDRFWDRIVARQESRISYAWLGVLCFIGGLTYVLARVFLVVEAFISIRQLPRAAYDTPDWTRLVPHL